MRRVAAFDFDGTITYRDSLLPFLLYSRGNFKGSLLIASQLPLFLSYLFGRAGRQEVKEGLLNAFFSGFSNEEMDILGDKFASSYLRDHVKPEALARLLWHQERGDLCILVSASIETYLIPWARLNGFHHVLSSKLFVDEEGAVNGKLLGANCRGEEKVRRLKALLGDLKGFEIFAYGDSLGDKELLETATHSFYRTFQ